jgi:hypothetical protein
MRQLLKKLEEAQEARSSGGMVPLASKIRGKAGSSEQERIHMTTQSSLIFRVTPSILRMEEIVGQTPIKTWIK